MVFVVVQIKCQGKVLKAWYGCLFPEFSISSLIYVPIIPLDSIQSNLPAHIKILRTGG